MNLIAIFESDFVDSTSYITINGRRHHHIKEVHRAKVGDHLRVGMIGGKIGTGEVVELNDSSISMKVDLSEDPPEALPLTLILALPRPIVFQRILQTITALGVKQIFLLHSNRVEKSYWQSPVLSEEKITKNLILGLEQAKDTILPTVNLRQKFKPFVEDELPALIKKTEALVAHPEASILCPTGFHKPVTLAIGPEGGFVDYEIGKFLSLGFKAVHLGPRILKVETSIPAVISKLF